MPESNRKKAARYGFVSCSINEHIFGIVYLLGLLYNITRNSWQILR